jgi:antitoxin component of RelBE/YafQ-DinJ toxin-antitoxin module
MNLNLEDIGLTQEELQKRVVEQIANTLCFPEDGSESDFNSEIQKAYRQQIVDGVKALAETVVAPRVSELLDKVTFQETNRWGESQKAAITLKEFLISRAEAWMTEKVDFNGRAKGEDTYGNWNGSQTRISHMIHEHLKYHIENSVKAALADINSKIAIGIQETVKLKLKETLDSLKVNVKVAN